MAKKIVGFIKLQVPAGKANPSPPIGPALGQRGLNIMEFCKAFNAQTQSYEPGLKLPVVITAYADKSFTFILKSPPATVLLKKAAKIEKGSGKPNSSKVGKITRAQALEIANKKRVDLNAKDDEGHAEAMNGRGGRAIELREKAQHRLDIVFARAARRAADVIHKRAQAFVAHRAGQIFVTGRAYITGQCSGEVFQGKHSCG